MPCSAVEYWISALVVIFALLFTSHRIALSVWRQTGGKARERRRHICCFAMDSSGNVGKGVRLRVLSSVASVCLIGMLALVLIDPAVAVGSRSLQTAGPAINGVSTLKALPPPAVQPNEQTDPRSGSGVTLTALRMRLRSADSLFATESSPAEHHKSTSLGGMNASDDTGFDGISKVINGAYEPFGHLSSSRSSCIVTEVQSSPSLRLVACRGKLLM